MWSWFEMGKVTSSTIKLELEDIPPELSDLSQETYFTEDPIYEDGGTCGNVPFMDQLSMFLLILHLCAPFYQGFHLKPRWFQRSKKETCATGDIICSNTSDQLEYLLLYSGWNQTIHCTRISRSMTTGSVMLADFLEALSAQHYPPPPSSPPSLTSFQLHIGQR